MKPISEMTDDECMAVVRESLSGGTYALQQANRRIAELERKNAELQRTVANLESQLAQADDMVIELEERLAASS